MNKNKSIVRFVKSGDSFLRSVLKCWKNENGSLMLDAALIVPVILFICYFMISAVLTVQHEAVMRYALDQTSKELSMLIPLSEAVYEGIRSEELDDLISKVSIDHQELRNSLADLGASVLLQYFLQSHIEKWADDAAFKLNIRIPPDQRQILITTSSDHALKLQLNYHIYTPWTATERSIVSYLPLWTKYDYSYQNTKESSDEDQAADNIWSEHNFTRGKYFREKYQANLPFNYPVISRFKNGEAFAIRSIDLTAPLYESPEQVQSQIDYEIERLAAFQGSEVNTKINPERIDAEAIKSKKLTIVVPGNSDYSLSDHLFQNAVSIANDRGIRLNFEVSGNSYRYKEKPETDD